MKKKYALATGLLLLTLCLGNISAKAQSKTGQFGDVLPPELNSEIFFGISLADFKNVNGSNLKLESERNDDFRLIYTQPNYSPDITYIVYYFNNEQHKPFYETIINYRYEEQAKKAGTRLFGQPNYNKTEWRIKMAGMPEIWSWIYKTKLVIVAKIPGSEWYNEWN
ncbi:hypothetical protein [Flagellimonas okinawensis]|uniref:Uncharacterized protein n=1 Tax=Flagellimonas okinawensis TaxID=3031324 RepID=A0ABT5XRP1_9FLAO|nr:hypothetical protein [[Muricauda] okinawensis]MDF0708477.1 hypothetical protein [[Muricauda] okinawensis]